MTYQLVFTEAPAKGSKDVGENVLLSDIPAAYKVYLFYYSGALPEEAMEGKLRQLGKATGKNLFVNIGALNDPQYGTIVARFGITKYPVIVMTAIDALASSPADYLSAYVRLDSEHLLESPDRTIKCVQEIFNLFIQGKVTDAISRAKSRQRAELLKWLTGFFAGALKSLASFIAERDISVSIAEGKFELKRSGG